MDTFKELDRMAEEKRREEQDRKRMGVILLGIGAISGAVGILVLILLAQIAFGAFEFWTG